MWGGHAEGVPVLLQARRPPQGGAARWDSSAEGGPAGKKTQGTWSMSSCKKGRRSQRSPLLPRKPGKLVSCGGEDCTSGMAHVIWPSGSQKGEPTGLSCPLFPERPGQAVPRHKHWHGQWQQQVQLAHKCYSHRQSMPSEASRGVS